MKKKFEKLKSSKRFRNIIKISSGTLGGQVVKAISIPIFTRIYGAEILGTWAFLFSISSLVNSFSDLGMKQAIMLGNQSDVYDEKVYRVVSSTTMVIAIASAALVSFFYAVVNPSGIGLNIPFLLFYLVFSIFTKQQMQICYTWINKKANYNVLMKNPLINSLTFSILGIVLGFSGFVNYGYFIAWIAGQFITLLHMKRFLPKGFFTYNLNDYKEVWCKNILFIKYQLPSNILVRFKDQIPVFFIRSFFGTAMLGYFSITVQILTIPTSLLGSAIGRTFFKEAADLNKEGKSLGEYTYKNMKAMMRIAIIPMALLIATGDRVVILFLGVEWALAGTMLVINSFRTYFRLLLMSVKGITALLQKQNILMIMNLSRIILATISFLVASFLFNDILVALILFAASEIIINVMFFCKLFNIMGISRKKYLKNVLTNYLIILLGALIIRIVLSILTV